MAQPTDLADKLDAWSKSFADMAQSIRKNPSKEALEGHRMNVHLVTDEIKRATQDPMEQFMGSLMTMTQMVAVKLFIKWKAFEAIPQEGSISYIDLAAKVGADEALIRRFAWTLVGNGTLEQVGTGEVAHTSMSKIFATDHPLKYGVNMLFDDHLTTMVKLPDFFDEYGLKEPTGRYKTAFAYTMGDPSLTVWEHLNRVPERMTNFMVTMKVMAQRFPTVGSYDFSWVAAKAKEDADRDLIVDVGGGKGHALETICQSAPGIPLSRCVVEDLKEVVEAAEKSAEGELASAKFVPMDFHSEQPIKGALVYYIRRCLHDYGDEDAADMLSQISKAMAADSKLLIVEEVLNDPPGALAAAQDMVMATIGGKERTLDNFKDIAGEAGLKVLEVHRSDGSGVAVVECAKQ